MKIMNKIEKFYFLIAAASAVISIILMLDESVFGATTSGMATIFSIIAIGLFAKRKRLEIEKKF
jgi:hypothetical protein